MFYGFDINNEIKPKLYLCKPDLNYTPITELNEAYGIKYYQKLGNINELTFILPYEIDLHHKLKRNPNIDLVRDRYLIKLQLDNYEEYFTIRIPSDSMNEDSDEKLVHCFSLGYELNDKLIKEYSVVSYNATQVLTDALSSTLWNIDYIDAEFDLTYRSFEVTSSTVLDFVFTIATTFGAVIIWNTKNRTISFYKQENIGLDRGLKFSFNKYLKSLNKEINSDEITTRIKIFGKDGISINAVNATGTNFIQDFSYFLYPFQRDESRNVLSHSYYMSDDLCHAILDYNDLLQVKEGEFSNLLSQKETLESSLTTKENELTNLENELLIIQDNLDIALANGDDTTQLIIDRNNKQAEINTKRSEIDQINSGIDNIDNQILILKNEVAMENNFTADQLRELNQFIIEKEVINEYIDDPKVLLNWGKEEFEKIKTPPIMLKINIVDLYKCLDPECVVDRKKLTLSEVVTIQYEKMNINFKAKIIELDIDFEDNDSLDITVANIQEIITDEESVLKKLNQLISSSTQIDFNKFKWNQAVATADEVSQIINNIWDATKRSIQGGVNESVSVDRRGIIIKDPTDPLSYLVAQHGVLAITNDGGNTWKHAITKNGIIGERIIGKLLLGNNLIISDDYGIFNMTGSLLTVKDNLGNYRVKLGNYADGKYGLQLFDKTGNITILDEDGIIQTWQDSKEGNLDSANPLEIHIYIPNEVNIILKAILRLKFKKFRANATGSASGGGVSTSPTTDSRGSHRHMVFRNMGTIWDDYEGFNTTSDTHSHSVSTNFPSGTHNHGNPDYVGTGDHTHSISLYSDSHNHTYNMPLKTVQCAISSAGSFANIGIGVPNSYNDIYTYEASDNHYHTVSINIPNHTHPINYGIFYDTTPSSVGITINGINRTSELGGPWNNDKDSIDIAPYMVTGQWNTISLTSSRRGRLDVAFFIQARIHF